MLWASELGVSDELANNFCCSHLQEADHQRAMQRRAIRDAKTPDKMKKSTSVKEDNSLSLQEKKEKIQTGLKKLTELGTVDPKNRYQELINDIARVLLWGQGWPSLI